MNTNATGASCAEIPAFADQAQLQGALGDTAAIANMSAPASASRNAIASRHERALYIAQTGLTAAVYAAATLLCLLLLQGLAWGPIQFRISEALCVVAVLMAPAVPGLTLGCIIANLINVALTGTGMLGMLDVVFGSLATLLGALWCRRFADKPKLAVAGFVIFNALIVPAYLPILLQGLGFYTIPFTNISLDGSYPLMYLFGLVATGIGEAAVIYLLGMPLLAGIKRALPRLGK